jgi:hypothetical protein
MDKLRKEGFFSIQGLSSHVAALVSKGSELLPVLKTNHFKVPKSAIFNLLFLH